MKGRGGRERAVLVGLVLPGDPPLAEPPLEELSRLAGTAGAEVVERVVQKRRAPHPATFLGRGKVREISELAAALAVDVVVFDHELSPAQAKNLEAGLGCRVIDRSEVILDIFATRARSRQAKVQVELAQLQYLRPRLRRLWTHLSRIEGGIGMRGPGEKQIEVDRRAVNRRIHVLEKELDEFERQHRVMSCGRRGYFSVSLVGYTNSGKSTLLNRLTGAAALIEDRLFATLDTTTRGWRLRGGKQVFLSDTVGFIRGLPHHLVASFHATLREAAESDLLLHVVDGANPDAGLQSEIVMEVLEEVGAGDVPRITVLNKVDLVKERMSLQLLRPRNGTVVILSARDGEGIDDLEEAVVGVIESTQVEVDLTVHPGNGRLLSYLSEKGEVLSRDYVSGEEVRIRARLPRRYARRLEGEIGTTWESGGADPRE